MCKHPLPASLHSRPISPLPHPSSQIIPFFQRRKYTSPLLHMPPGGHTYYMQETGFLRFPALQVNDFLLLLWQKVQLLLPLFSLFSVSFFSFPPLFLSYLLPAPTPPVYFPHPHPLRNEGEHSPKCTYNAPKSGIFLSLSKRLCRIYIFCVAKVSNLFFTLILPHYSFPSLPLLSLRQKLLHDKGKIRAEGEKRREG